MKRVDENTTVQIPRVIRRTAGNFKIGDRRDAPNNESNLPYICNNLQQALRPSTQEGGNCAQVEFPS